MKISIIVPVYNVEKYLRDCIESVVRQAYEDFELILIDDGSTDGSGLICDEYAVNYPQKVRSIHKKNDGVMQARIDGICEATGNILIFLDSDDCLSSEALERIANSFKQTNCQMLIYNIAETCKFPSISFKHSFLNGQSFEGKEKNFLYQKIIEGEISNSICNKAVSAECIKIPKQFEQYKFIAGEDLLLSVCFLTNCNKVVFIEDGLYYYRNRPGSAIHSYNAKRKESIKGVHAEIGRYIDQWGMPELRPLHNARKVRGWMDQLKLLLKNRKNLTKEVFKTELLSMSEDIYFRFAYKHMDKKKISFKNRILAFCLYYRIINCLM